MKNKILFSGFCFCFSVFCFAQKGTVATGGSGSGSGGSVEYSVGQIDYITMSTAGNGTITSGLQQPYEIQIMTGIEWTEINLSTVVYPNPVYDFVVLSVSNSPAEKMEYTLNDMQGKIIFQQKVAEEKTNISMKDLSNGVYFISVIENNKTIKTFKIIKNN